MGGGFFVVERTIVVRQVVWAPSHAEAKEQVADRSALDVVTDALQGQIPIDYTVANSVMTVHGGLEFKPEQAVWVSDEIASVSDVLARLIASQIRVMVQMVDDHYRIIVPVPYVQEAVPVVEQYVQDTNPVHGPVLDEAESA